jgi:hypothetical protein
MPIVSDVQRAAVIDSSFRHGHALPHAAWRAGRLNNAAS